MNIEGSIKKAKEFINYLPLGVGIISFRKGQFIDCQIAIGTLLTAYEKEKEKNKEYEILLKRQKELEKEKENLIKQGWLNE